jgi:hypothetical protein
VDTSRAQLKDLGNGRYSLTIPQTNADDFGNYSVTVSNDAGEATSKGKISVEAPKLEKPEILEGLKPVTVKPGDDAVFQARVKNPVKQDKWYKNGDELKNPQVEHSGDTYKLIIPNAQLDDAGDYKVRI